jgi:hypothetical protein
VHDRALSESKPSLAKFGQTIWDGPYVIVKGNDNCTVRLWKGIITEIVNIRKMKMGLNPIHGGKCNIQGTSHSAISH